jgi:hypothetical protein
MASSGAAEGGSAAQLEVNVLSGERNPRGIPAMAFLVRTVMVPGLMCEMSAERLQANASAMYRCESLHCWCDESTTTAAGGDRVRAQARIKAQLPSAAVVTVSNPNAATGADPQPPSSPCTPTQHAGGH